MCNLAKLRSIATLGPQWTAIRGIGNSPAVRLTIFIPLIGYAIIFNENIVQYLNLSKDIFASTNIFGQHDAFSTQATISWRLLCLYFGLCLVASGSLIYAWRCPGLIKTYSTATEFVSSVRPHTANFVMETIYKELAHSTLSETFEEVVLTFRDYVHVANGPDELTRIHDERAREILSLYFVLKNGAAPASRTLAIAFYAIGFTAIALPSFDIFSRVCRQLFDIIF